jgi:cytochrome c oxidase subunit 1
VDDYLQPLIPVHKFITIAALFTGFAQMIFLVYNLIHSRFWGAPASDNPWQATSLEWSTPTTPPPHNNFGDKLPVVYHDPYQYGVEGSAGDYVMQTSPEKVKICAASKDSSPPPASRLASGSAWPPSP